MIYSSPYYLLTCLADREIFFSPLPRPFLLRNVSLVTELPDHTTSSAASCTTSPVLSWCRVSQAIRHWRERLLPYLLFLPTARPSSWSSIQLRVTLNPDKVSIPFRSLQIARVACSIQITAGTRSPLGTFALPQLKLVLNCCWTLHFALTGLAIAASLLTPARSTYSYVAPVNGSELS